MAIGDLKTDFESAEMSTMGRPSMCMLTLWAALSGCGGRAAARRGAMANWKPKDVSIWLKEIQGADDYVIALYREHDVVILGEAHNISQHKSFVRHLIPRLYYEAKVRAIAWEFSCHEDDNELNQMVTAFEWEPERLLDFARRQLPDWNSLDHWELPQAVWRFNASLSQGQQPMRFYGLRSRNDIVAAVEMSGADDGSERFDRAKQHLLRSDVGMAEQVEKQILTRNIKAFVFVGRCHDMTRYQFAPDVNCGRPIMGNLLYQKYGRRVFQVWPYSGLFPAIETAMVASGRTTGGANVAGSPFAQLTSSSFIDAPNVEFCRLADGFVYLGPVHSMSANRSIEGFVTDDMFGRLRSYYEAFADRRFDNAKQLDEYLQRHRWPSPNRSPTSE